MINYSGGISECDKGLRERALQRPETQSGRRAITCPGRTARVAPELAHTFGSRQNYTLNLAQASTLSKKGSDAARARLEVPPAEGSFSALATAALTEKQLSKLLIIIIIIIIITEFLVLLQ